LSIGDVLALLREEFPDITISKIRFLESRGLLVPERTPSGYRKFYDHDVDRLRWILRQQREHFLPLKVIKGRLEGQAPPSEPAVLFEVQHVPAGHPDASDGPPPGLGEGVLEPVLARNGSYSMLEGSGQGAAPAAAAVVSRGQPASSQAPMSGLIAPRPQPSASTRQMAAGRAEPQGRASVGQSTRREDHRQGSSASPRPHAGRSAQKAGYDIASRGDDPSLESSGLAAAEAAAPGIRSSARASDVPGAGGIPEGSAGRIEPDTALATRAVTSEGGHDPATGEGDGARVMSGRGDGPGDPAVATGAGHPDGTALSGASLTAAELAQASGLDENQVSELEAYGLIESRLVAGVHCYDEEALVVAGLAASFARFGVEARHLKLFKHAAERQASLYSQVVMPLLRQRNPDARRRAHDDLTRLSELGASMQACFAKAVLRDLTRG